MQLSPDLRTCRGSSCLSTSKQSTSFAVISKSLTISQSQGKALQRYFYRRESTNDKIQPIPLRKIKIQKVSSFHDQSYISKSAKNTLITNGNDDSREIQLMDVPIFKDDKASEPNQDLKRQNESVKLEERTRKIFRKTSDWTVMHHKNTHLFTKSRKLQSGQFKIKINPRPIKEKSTIASNMDLVIKKHKAENVREIEQKMRSVMSRGGLYDSQKVVSMKEYNKKCGYSEDKLIFIWNSEDEHLRRMLLSWGWIQNNSAESPFFHFKWTYMPNFTESIVKQKQFINHFKNTHQITSKSYLTKNLKISESSFGKLNNYYPKCFDVGNQSEWMYFIEQYRHNIMLILLKRLYQVFVAKRPREMLNFDLFYTYHFSRDAYGAMINSKSQKSVFRNKRFRQIQLEDFRKRSADFLVQVNMVIEVLKYWRNFRKQKSEYEDNSYHFLQFNQFKFLDAFSELQTYALFDDLCVPRLEANFTKQMYSTPSQLLLERVSKQYQFCKHSGNLFPTYGLNNIWIVKPTSNSRGSGIYLTTDLYQIQSSSKGIQSRLVQKYIERPLIIKNKKWSELYMKKFDIRQWVLVKSIDPIEIYIFSECYLRLCYDSYKVEQISQLYRHLTNYSINKQKFKNKQQSVLPLSYLTRLLEEQYRIDWYKEIRPQIESIIIKSIRSCVENLDDCGGNCFELFGYDILIDEEFRPWLLEINMSPACEERTPWLTDYLQDMGQGLLRLVLPKQFLPSTTIQQTNYKWELILKEEAYFNRKKDVEQGLEIVGTGVKLNFQKDVDRHLIEDRNAIKIQKFFKKYLPRYRKYKQEKNKKEKVIFDYLASFHSFIEFRAKEKACCIGKLNKYFSSITPHIFCKTSIKKSETGSIQKYIKTFLSVRNFQKDLTIFREQVFMSLAKSLKLKAQLSMFCSQIIVAHAKIALIQQKIRDYINFRKQKKRALQKYFKTILQLKILQIKKVTMEKQANTKELQKYFHPLLLLKRTQGLIELSKKKLICRYLGSLFNRQQFYKKKIQIFHSLVGRVVRVTKRRTRCDHFKTILEVWKSQIQRQRQKIMESEVQRIKKIIQMSKQKNSHGELLGRVFKPGSIRPNKK